MVRIQHDSAGKNNNGARRFVLCMTACLLLSRLAVGQSFPPNQGALMAPGQVFQPRNAYGTDYMPRQELLPVNGDQEQGALQNMSFSQPVGDLGMVNLYGSTDPENFGAGAGFSINPAAWLYFRDLQTAVYTNPEQTVVTAGSTFTLYSSDHFGVGGRALAGATIDDDLQDGFHFSGDAFAGFRLPGEIWIKGGFLYDYQDSFYKYGPTLGVVFLADAKHPITLDAAYGKGDGDVRTNVNRTGFVAIADHDVQVRVGTYLSPMAQIGLSGNWARWDNALFQDDSGIGGFARISIADLELTVDVTNGNLGTRGFANIAYVFGGPHRKNWSDPCASGFVDSPQDWMTRPVIRDASLRVQQVVTRQPSPPNPPNPPNPPDPPPGTVPVVGNVTQVLCRLQVDPNADQVNPGVIDPGDGFQLVVTLGNGSTFNATGVSITNLAADAGFVVFNTPSSEVTAYPDLPANGSAATMAIPSIPLGISAATQQGSAFSLTFQVTSDGQTRQFRCGPIILGQSGNATPVSMATPL